MTDEDLLQQRIQSGDKTALAELIEQQREQLLAYLAKITGDHLRSKTELEDLLQEISAQAITSFETAPFDRMPASAWLRELAQRKVVDAHRHFFEAKKRAGNREVALDAPRGSDGNDGKALVDMIVQSLTTPSAAMSRNLRERRLWQAISELPEEQRDAIRLRYVDGLATKEIADRLGKSDAAIRVLLSRSMRKLESQLDDVRPSR